MTNQEFREIAGLVWHVLKEPADPDFGGCAEDHCARLAYKVESVFKSGRCDDAFERIAGQLLEMPREKWGPFIVGLKNPAPQVEIDLPAQFAENFFEPPTPAFQTLHADAQALEEQHPPEARNEPEITEGFDSPKSSREAKGE